MNNTFKKLLTSGLLFTIIFLLPLNISAKQYAGQKNTYYYTVDFPDYPEKWELVDDSKGYNAFFRNESQQAFIEVTVYDLYSSDTNQALFDSFVQRFNMKGKSNKTTFCNYNAVSGNYEFVYNKADFVIDMVVFKDNYYYYVVMGYCYKNSYDKYKKELEDIMYSCKIYYDNNVVYGNDRPNQAETKKKDFEQKDDSKYAIHIKWDNKSEQFEFIKADFEEAIKEIDKIGKFTGNYWNGWKYFNIDLYNDPDYEFTFWTKFYQEMFSKNYYRANSVYEYFENLAKKEKLSSYDLAKTVMHCIQVIPYERPKNIAEQNSGAGILDFFSPNEVAYYNKGDCDTKSLFMVIILRRLGFDAVMYHSAYYGHAMVGLNINASGVYKTYNGNKYYFIESTYPGWKIGDIPPNMSDTDKWRLIPIK